MGSADHWSARRRSVLRARHPRAQRWRPTISHMTSQWPSSTNAWAGLKARVAPRNGSRLSRGDALAAYTARAYPEQNVSAHVISSSGCCHTVGAALSAAAAGLYSRNEAFDGGRAGRRTRRGDGGRAGFRLPRLRFSRTVSDLSQYRVRRAIHVRAHPLYASARRQLVRRMAGLVARLSARRAEPDEDHERGELPQSAHGGDQRAHVRRSG